MTSVISEEVIFTVPDPTILRPKADAINIRQGTFVDLFATNATITNLSVGSLSVTGFTFAHATNIQTVSSITAAGTVADVYFAIIPKGTGGIIADIPDNAATGGNARGQFVVDLQQVRSAPGQVAAGNFSTISGGHNNSAGTDTTTVCGGFGNVAFATGSTVCGGVSNTTNGFRSIVCGGEGNTTSGFYAITLGGFNNVASGVGSVAAGSFSNAVNDGAYVFSDSTAVALTSTLNNQFLARFVAGYYLNNGPIVCNNNYRLFSGGTITVGAPGGVSYSIPISGADNVYFLTAKFTVRNGNGVPYTDTAIHWRTARIVQQGGVITTTANSSILTSSDASIAAADTFFSVIGASLSVVHLGVVGFILVFTGTLEIVSIGL